RDLLAVGSYAKCSDPLLDYAIALFPQLEKFLQQGIGERADYAGSLAALRAILGSA
ncbi:MAG: flagellum-specific ATP synthase FliI, partial [Rhodocyclales bacterium]|nr:flagellum-specific ATP synthase FliI [Rhodocyclales bacterium]